MINKVIARGAPSKNPFQVDQDRPGRDVSEQFEEAVVVDVIVNNDHTEYARDGYNVGAVKFRFISSNYFRPDETLHWAFSLDANISDYPLINELVYVFRSLNRFYYLKKFNVLNRPTSQPFFGVIEDTQPLKSSSDNTKIARSASASPIKQDSNNPNATKLGKYFTEQISVFKLKHLEGDIIYEGRSGQSIRMGSAWKDGVTGDVTKKPFKSLKQDQSPNMLFRIGPDPNAKRTVNTPYGLVVEDINLDKTSLWMVTDQVVPLEYSTQKSGLHRVSIPDFPKQLDGNQIVINSDRIVINSKKDKILGHSALGIHWTTLQNFSADAGQDHITWTNRDRADRVVRDWRKTIGRNHDVSAGSNIIVVSGQNSTFGAGKNMNFVASKVTIGGAGANEPLVLGNSLVSFLMQLCDALTQDPVVLVTSRPGGSSRQNPVRTAKIKALKSQFLSGGSSAKILSLDNYTIRKNQRPPQPRKISPYKEG